MYDVRQNEIVSMNAYQLTKLSLAGCLATLLAACYVPDRAAHASLNIDQDGGYVFNGHRSSAAQLGADIASANPSGAPLYVEIHASPAADMKTVEVAVHEIKTAHAHVAFAGEARTQ